MHCFIPFSEVLVEQYPELLDSGLVPYSEEYRQCSIEYEIIPVAVVKKPHGDETGLSVQKNEFQKS
jgi:hypothetical protein